MSTDLNIETLLTKGKSFVHANSVSSTSPMSEIVEKCLQWEQDGIPFVIRGAPPEMSHGSPFTYSAEWLEHLARPTSKFPFEV